MAGLPLVRAGADGAAVMSGVAPERVRFTRVRTVRVECDCAVVGCAGKMRATGAILTSNPPWHVHRCSMCGLTENFLDEYFPRTEHVEE